MNSVQRPKVLAWDRVRLRVDLKDVSFHVVRPEKVLFSKIGQPISACVNATGSGGPSAYLHLLEGHASSKGFLVFSATMPVCRTVLLSIKPTTSGRQIQASWRYQKLISFSRFEGSFVLALTK